MPCAMLDRDYCYRCLADNAEHVAMLDHDDIVMGLWLCGACLQWMWQQTAVTLQGTTAHVVEIRPLHCDGPVLTFSIGPFIG